MKQNSFSFETLLISILIAPLAYMVINWSQLPVDVATHFDLQGRPNGWMSKENLALFIATLLVIVYLALRFLPAYDKTGKPQTSNYQKLRFVVTAMLSVLMGWFLYKASHTTSGGTFISGLLAIVSLMLAGIGNYLTTVRPNWFIGIRTPWTLDNEVVWRKTHRLGGRLFMAGGLLNALLSVVLPVSFAGSIVLASTLFISFVPVVYSYICFREEKNRIR